MNNAFYAQELSDDQLEMVVGAGHKSGGNTTLRIDISQSTSASLRQSASSTAGVTSSGDNYKGLGYWYAYQNGGNTASAGNTGTVSATSNFNGNSVSIL